MFVQNRAHRCGESLGTETSGLAPTVAVGEHARSVDAKDAMIAAWVRFMGGDYTRAGVPRSSRFFAVTARGITCVCTT
jgi:hypothetical protein